MKVDNNADHAPGEELLIRYPKLGPTLQNFRNPCESAKIKSLQNGLENFVDVPSKMPINTVSSNILPVIKDLIPSPEISNVSQIHSILF